MTTAIGGRSSADAAVIAGAAEARAISASTDEMILAGTHRAAARITGPLCIVLGVSLALEGAAHLAAGDTRTLLIALPIGFAIALAILRWRLAGVAKQAAPWLLLPWAAILASSLAHVAAGSDPTMSLVLCCALLVGVGALPLNPGAFMIAMITTTACSIWLSWAVGGAAAIPAALCVSAVTWFARNTRRRALREDINARELEQALARREAEVERLDQLAKMAAGVAHHANNQLAGILGGANRLGGRLAHDEEAREDLRIIEDSAQALAETIGALRIYAEIGREQLAPSTPYTPVTISALIDQARVESSIADGVDVQVAIETDLPALNVAGDRLAAALSELVRNASDASRVTGADTITVSASRHEDGAIELAVHDRGEGLDPETARRLTNPFHTNREPTRRGLGLSIALATAHMHGGHLDFRREDDETIVAMVLPASAAA